MANERKTDYFIAELLKTAKIQYQPNESNIKEIDDALKTASKRGTGHRGFPEFVGMSGVFPIVIEDKADLDRQALYEDEEQRVLSMETKAVTGYAENGALHYAQIIVEKTSFKKVFAFGCTGNERHHKIRPIYVDENGYQLMPLEENFRNFSQEHIKCYFREKLRGETPQEALELEQILKSASALHESLRNYGQLRDSEKPLVVSAILLALSDPVFRMDSLMGDEIQTDGAQIYATLSAYLNRRRIDEDSKRERILNQFTIIKDRPILNRRDDRLMDAERKHLGKTPIKYFAEYLKQNILKPVFANSQEDVLGRFYSEFIRYSGGDGQSLGVVLTPRHITELFCGLAALNAADVVFDPCCGTGSFLIAAMTELQGLAEDEEQKKRVREEQVYGMEIREDMYTVACTNMLLRNTGVNHLECEDFLKTPVAELRKIGYTAGFMNPPYSQAKGKSTAHLSELHFIRHLLDGMADDGLAVVIVPQSVMIGKTGNDKLMKEALLKAHTLEGVITLNPNTFYRVGTNPCIAVFRAHAPHPAGKYCKFINFEDDGFEVNKHVGLVETEQAKDKRIHLLDCWHNDKPADNSFMVKTPVKASDEWLHAFYYFNDALPAEEDFAKTMADYLSFEFNMIAHGRGYLFRPAEKEERRREGRAMEEQLQERKAAGSGGKK